MSYAIVDLLTILSRFKTGDKPTQQQFGEAWTSMRHKLDAIPIADITNLQNTLNQKASTTDVQNIYNILNNLGTTRITTITATSAFATTNNASWDYVILKQTDNSNGYNGIYGYSATGAGAGEVAFAGVSGYWKRTLQSEATQPYITATGLSSVAIPAGTFIDAIVFADDANPTVNVGTTNGGHELIDAYTLTGGLLIYALGFYAKTTTTLYISGANVGTVIKIYKR